MPPVCERELAEGRKPVHEPVHEVGALLSRPWGWLKHTGLAKCSAENP